MAINRDNNEAVLFPYFGLQQELGGSPNVAKGYPIYGYSYILTFLISM
jgi:hypothetical protein